MTYQDARRLAAEALNMPGSAAGWDTGTAFYVLMGDPEVKGGIVAALVDKTTGVVTPVSSLAARTAAAGAVRAH